MYKIDIARSADRFLDKLDKATRTRIEAALKRLEHRPIPNDAKVIGREAGEQLFRYRIGDYRALYTVMEKAKVVLIVTIDKRSRVYAK